MHSIVDGDPRLLAWRRAREFAVPPTMIETAAARRLVGDWGGACAAARVDVDLDLRAIAGAHGHEVARRIRLDLRHLAPDLLRWHMPRAAPDFLLRPGVTLSLARYRRGLHLVARTAPAWAEAGQRISLVLWSGIRDGRHPDRRFRLDLHRHLWDARRTAELRERVAPGPDGLAVSRWQAEADILRRADGRAFDPVAVRVGARQRFALDPGGTHPREVARPDPRWPILPDTATWVLPDLELLRAGLINLCDLHPLVAAALGPGQAGVEPRAQPVRGRDGARLVQCRGAEHRIALVDGLLSALDHDPGELRREELLVALGGPPLPCLRAIDEAHRNPAGLADIRGLLDHGDTAGAVAAVERLLGADAVLREGPLRDELESAAARRVTYGLYRAGLAGRGPLKRTQGDANNAGNTRRRRRSARPARRHRHRNP
ncbi:hypothetical protein HH310_39870 [Actinoplanes sp. TBRC 11911]|uniref:hypothetical protein n=1 Tax=Actinoplanes sp. TBRC 11911 TaxID=2729386 RepID=UPI00145F37A1|nr:hypothetical protein [Actinoplanes sp. TBRC 11911]NMO57317.1 hypothetical protein [Actinoplanes sp. TBRC 11911]